MEIIIIITYLGKTRRRKKKREIEDLLYIYTTAAQLPDFLL